MNHLEQLIAEWLEFTGYLVKRNINVCKLTRGGFEGELDESHHRSTLGGWRFEGLPWEQC